MSQKNRTSLDENPCGLGDLGPKTKHRRAKSREAESEVDLRHVYRSWIENNRCTRCLVLSRKLFVHASYPMSLGAGQMGLGIAYVASLRARVPVFLVDKSTVQIEKSLSLMDKLLAKDVSKGKISEQEAKDARARITVVSGDQGINGLKDVDLVVEVSYAPDCRTCPKT